MKRKAFLGSLALVLLAGAALAQEPAPPAYDPQEDEQLLDDQATDERAEPVRKIRVLENPYDLASYYRSSQGGFLDYRPDGGSYGSGAYEGRYPISSYYRLRGSGDRRGYGPFWTNGYSSQRPRFLVGYRHRIGENGDLFLFAPTFLSPIGPLTDAFFDR